MTDKQPPTTQFFLPQGEPRSIRIADITTPIVHAVRVARSKLQEAAKRDELKSAGIQFLFGEQEDAAKPWKYGLLRHDAIVENMTLTGLAPFFTIRETQDT